MMKLTKTIGILCAGLLTAGYGANDSLLTCTCPPSQYEGGTYYSQYYEDYILAYVFKDMKKGFYIDVGANDPNKDNVTRYFYERGWRGINIEPNTDLWKELVRCRPGDSNYNCGISDEKGKLSLYQENDGSTGLSTFDKDIAEKEKKERGVKFKEVTVPVITLNNLLAKLPIPSITFISIDVEGYEKKVIAGIDLATYRPMVLCIEADQPLTEIPSYMAWEKMLLDKQYVFAIFDGLNRYYVHKDHVDLLPRFIDIDRCVKKSKFKRRIKMDGRASWE
jgi:FkbM family methyltransferase